MKSREVVVVGAGPAGLVAAIAARQRGFDVTVLDARTPPIDKPCGEGILPRGVAALNALGILLPAENAVGNYVKVVQRVPVKILLDGPLDSDLDIAPGMSVVPRVRVK